LFVLAQIYEIAAVLAILGKLDIFDGKPYIEAYHQCGECSPQILFPLVSGLYANQTSTGMFLHLIVFTVQAGEQTSYPGTVGSARLYQRVGTGKGLFVVHQSRVGRFRAGCQAEKESQQEKKRRVFHLECIY